MTTRRRPCVICKRPVDFEGVPQDGDYSVVMLAVCDRERCQTLLIQFIDQRGDDAD